MENARDINMLDPPYPGLYGSIADAPPSVADIDVGNMSLRAAQACLSCRKQKRKCDKALPACNLCQRMSRPCDYSDSTPTPNADDFAFLRKRVTDLEARLESQTTAFGRTSSLGSRGADLSARESPQADQISVFPSIYFLDGEIFKEGKMSVPKPALPVSSEITATIGSIMDVRDIVERYFENVHLWLPIVSKKRMQLTLSQPQFDLPADFALLLLCMKLITQSSHGSPQAAQTPLYAMTKRQVVVVESGALMTLQFLQSCVLLAAYEIGHAIYPAAYLTTGQSARVGHLLGLNDKDAYPRAIRRQGAWAEIEETKRTWWACTLLDRYVTLGIDGRPLATEDPSTQTVLPADDGLWDLGEMTSSEPLYVSSPTNVRAGAYARSCQAAHLMGKLIRLVNDRATDSILRFQEAAQLYRTISALATVLPDELHQSPLQFITPLSLCYGALIHLCDPFCCTETNRGDHTVEETEMQVIAIDGIKKIANALLHTTGMFRSLIRENISGISPLTLDGVYMAATTYAWLAHESGSAEDLANYRSLRELLVQLNVRWAAAGEYVKALDATKNVLYPDNPNL